MIGASLDDRLPGVSALLHRRLRETVPEYAADVDPALAEHESRRITMSLRSFCEGLRDGQGPSSAVLHEAAKEARAAAQLGLDLNALIRTYRVVQAEIWDAVLTCAAGLVPDADRQLAVERHISGFHFRWNDTVVSAVVQAYQDEQRDFFFQSRDRRLRAALRDLLAGRTDELPAVAYSLSGAHLAAVVWGDRPDAVIDELSAGAEAVLSVRSTSGATLVWLASQDSAAAPRADLAVPAGAHVAFGEAGTGVAGFRASHQQARRAYRVGRLCNASVTRYRDVALESLFLHDLQAARDLVSQQLGPLGLTDPRTDVLHATLSAYFGAGCNAVKAAAALKVHERTITYRLRTVEKTLGIDVLKRRDELAVALRLLKVLRAISATTSPVDHVVPL